MTPTTRDTPDVYLQFETHSRRALAVKTNLSNAIQAASQTLYGAEAYCRSIGDTERADFFFRVNLDLKDGTADALEIIQGLQQDCLHIIEEHVRVLDGVLEGLEAEE